MVALQLSYVLLTDRSPGRISFLDAKWGRVSRIPHPHGVVIGRGAVIGAGCTLLQGVTLGEKRADGGGDHTYPVLGDLVVVGAGVVILGSVCVGSDAIIGANSVVTRDVPCGTTVLGAPARVAERLAESE